MEATTLLLRFYNLTFWVIAILISFSVLSLGNLAAVAQTDRRGLRVHSNESVNKWPSSEKRYALIIGVDEYDDKRVGQLSGASNDARMLAKVLEENAGFPPSQIVLLTSDQTGDKRSTRANILREMSDLTSAVPKDGLFLLSFSGHGMERSYQVFLLPSDAQVKTPQLLEQTAVPAALIADWFRTRVQQVLIIIDACRSAPREVVGLNMPALPGIYDLERAFSSKTNMDERNQKIAAFAIFYATESGKQAYEDTKRQQGFLTGAVVKGLRGEAANDKGDVTLGRLVKYVQDAVPMITKNQVGVEQRPFCSIEGYKADELIIAVAKR